MVLAKVVDPVEAEVDCLQDGLPFEDFAIEVKDSYRKVTFQDVFFEGDGLGEADGRQIDLEDRDKDISSAVDEVE